MQQKVFFVKLTKNLKLVFMETTDFLDIKNLSLVELNELGFRIISIETFIEASTRNSYQIAICRKD